MLAIAFPVIDPVLISIGPFAIRWYALAYIVGLLLDKIRMNKSFEAVLRQVKTKTFQRADAKLNPP